MELCLSWLLYLVWQSKIQENCVRCGPLEELTKFWEIIDKNKETLSSIAKVLGIGSVTAVTGAARKHWQARRQQTRLRQIPDGDFPFEVLPPRTPDVVKWLLPSTYEDGPLEDFNIPYQQRQQGRNVRQELERAFEEKPWVLITGRTGLGKTREAANFAQNLCDKGWTILKLEERSGAWLDEPSEFPGQQVNPNHNLLFVIDDLDRWVYRGSPRERRQGNDAQDLTIPLQTPVQVRLLRVLEFFERECRQQVRVIAMARNEQEEWSKLEWEKYSQFWQRFQQYELALPEDRAVVELLNQTVPKTKVQVDPKDYEMLAQRNDQTFRNIVVNLRIAESDGIPLNGETLAETLDATWRKSYKRAVEKYPGARYIYDSVDLLRQFNLRLHPVMVERMAQVVAQKQALEKFMVVRQIRQAMSYLRKVEGILQPRDGQIEVKGTKVKGYPFIPNLLDVLSGVSNQYKSLNWGQDFFYLGNAAYSAKLYDEALDSYTKAVDSQPKLYEAWNNKGLLLEELGFSEKSIICYENALEINPDFYQGWSNLGISLNSLRRHEDAIYSCEKALSLNPKLCEALNLKGLSFLGQELYQEALDVFLVSVGIRNSDATVWYLMGVSLSNLGRDEEAISSYDKAVEIKPDNHEAWYARGVLLSNLGRDEEAIASYDKAVEIKPDDHEAWYARGVSFSNLGRDEKAIASYDKAVKIKPDDYEVWSKQGISLFNLGRYEDAIISYDKALSIRPNDANTLYNQACAYALQNHLDPALTNLKSAIELEPEEYRQLAQTDSDFDNIRQDPRFQQLINPDSQPE